MDYVKLDKKAVASWRIGRLIGFVFVLIICGALCFLSSLIGAIAPYRWLVLLVLGLFTLYKLVGLILYPLIEYRQWGYFITEEKVDIRHGIFFITNTIIPIVRIQHITVSQGPINRKLGLYDVEMSLASDSFTIECLAKEVADEIAENLREKLYVRLEAREQREGGRQL